MGAASGKSGGTDGQKRGETAEMKKKITAPVIENKKIAEDIYDMTLDAPEIAEQAAAGQFVSQIGRAHV